MTHPTRRFLRVAAGGKDVVIALDAVREVVAMCTVTPADPVVGSVRGVIDLRGDVVPVVDLTGPAEPLRPSRSILVCPVAEGLVGLVVDDVLDLVEVPPSDVSAPDRTHGRPAHARVGGRLLTVLEPTDVGVGRATGGVDGPLEPGDDELLRTRAVRYASADATRTGLVDLVRFTRGGRRFAVELAPLREIRLLDRPVRVVGAGPVVPGMFAFRGSVLGLHDPGVYFGGAPTPPGRWVLVVEHGAERLGVLADEVDDVVGVPHAAVRPVPLTFGPRGACVAGVFDDDVLVLRPSGLFHEPSFHLGA